MEPKPERTGLSRGKAASAGRDATAIDHDPFDVTWRERLVVLGGVAAALAVAYALGMVFARSATMELLALIPASFFVAGKFLPLWSLSGKSNFGPYQLGAVIWAMDTVTVLVIVYALEGLYWIRWLKRRLDQVQDTAHLVLEAYPWMRRTAMVGLVLFVLFPLAGTGAIGGAFIGILLGIHRARLIAAVSLGGLLGGMLMAFLASNFANALKDLQAAQANPLIKYLVIAAVAAVLVAGVMALTRMYRRALSEAQQLGGPEPERK